MQSSAQNSAPDSTAAGLTAVQFPKWLAGRWENSWLPPRRSGSGTSARRRGKQPKEKARQEHLAAIAGQKHLDALAGQEPELWTQVEELIATKLPKSYDLAVQRLVDLRDLAVSKDEEAAFSRRLTVLREAHLRKPAFIGRLQDEGLGS